MKYNYNSSIILLLSIFLPGLGQFVQKRFMASCFYFISNMVALFWLTRAINKAITIFYNTNVACLKLSCTARVLFLPEIFFPLIIFGLFYSLNICDIKFAEFKRKSMQSEIEFAQKMGIMILVVAMILNLSFCEIATAQNIFTAIQENNPLLISHVIESNRYLAVQSGINGITPLHAAAAKNNTVIMSILIAAGADIEAKTSEGFTPLHWAVSRDATDAARILIRLGANINAQSNNGITPLHWAAAKNATNSIKLLIAAGAKLDLPTESGMFPRHWAIKAEANEAAEILIFKEVCDSSVEDTTIIDPQLDSNVITSSISDRTLSTQGQTVDLPVKRAIPGETLIVPLGFGHELSFVWIPSLRIWFGKYEVTNGQYRRFKPDHDSLKRESYSLNNDNQPVVYVSWQDAMEYCKWLNTNFSNRIPEKCIFRLPTSKEWQHVASCGTTRKYPWGDKLPPKYLSLIHI